MCQKMNVHKGPNLHTTLSEVLLVGACHLSLFQLQFSVTETPCLFLFVPTYS